MKRFLSFLALWLLSHAPALAQTWQWALADSLDNRGLTLDSAGNLYALVAQRGPQRWSIVVRDPAGAVLRQFPVAQGVASSRPQIGIGRGQRLYVTGGFTQQATFGTITLPGSPAIGGGGYLASFTASGHLRWVRPLPNVGRTAPNRLLDAADNAYVAVTLYRTDSTVTPPVPYQQIWVARYDSLGNQTGSWRSDHTPGNPDEYYAQWVCPTPDGGFLLHGAYNAQTTRPSFSGVPLRPTQPFHSVYSLLVRYDRQGNVRWVIDEGIVNSPGVAVAANGDTYLCVEKTGGRQQIGDSTLTSPSKGLVLLKVDTSGHVRWLHALMPPLPGWISQPNVRLWGEMALTAPQQVTLLGDIQATSGSLRQQQLLLVTADGATATATVVAGARFEPLGVPIGDMISPVEMARRPNSHELTISGGIRGTIPFSSISLSASTATNFLARYAAPVLAVPAELPAAPRALAAWPNPLVPGQPLTVSPPPAAARLVLTNALGQPVRHWERPADGAWAPLPTAGLAPGLYWLRAGTAITRLVVAP